MAFLAGMTHAALHVALHDNRMMKLIDSDARALGVVRSSFHWALVRRALRSAACVAGPVLIANAAGAQAGAAAAPPAASASADEVPLAASEEAGDGELSEVVGAPGMGAE